ncbi:Lreu_0056 family protein [Ligilactobacillus sp. LYQ60]|uniref:Lreu_0056 family protein n=1 Tax=unclassified Ligilactobacillus TaxID=2767920 RepID=UPI003853D95E
MKKRAVVLGLGLGVSLLLAGCGQQVSHHESHHHDTPTHQQAQPEQHNQSKQIVLNNSQATQSSSSSNAVAVNPEHVHLTTQQLGTLVALLKYPNWFKQGVAAGSMYYSDQPNTAPGSDLNGFSYVTANGDPTSYLYFQLQGENVVIKYVDVSNADCVADAPMRTVSVRLDTLINDYYNTKKKQDEVNGYANRLLPESQYGKNADNQNQSTGD